MWGRHSSAGRWRSWRSHVQKTVDFWRSTWSVRCRHPLISPINPITIFDRLRDLPLGSALVHFQAAQRSWSPGNPAEASRIRSSRPSCSSCPWFCRLGACWVAWVCCFFWCSFGIHWLALGEIMRDYDRLWYLDTDSSNGSKPKPLLCNSESLLKVVQPLVWRLLCLENAEQVQDQGQPDICRRRSSISSCFDVLWYIWYIIWYIIYFHKLRMFEHGTVACHVPPFPPKAVLSAVQLRIRRRAWIAEAAAEHCGTDVEHSAPDPSKSWFFPAHFDHFGLGLMKNLFE